MTNKERIGYDEKVYTVTFMHRDSGFGSNTESASKEELRIDYDGMMYFRAEKLFSGEEISRCRFRAKPETVVKLFEKIDIIRQNGEMKSSNDFATDVGTYSIDVNYNGENIETEGCFGFPKWAAPILKSVRMLFINYGQGFRPGLLFDI